MDPDRASRRWNGETDVPSCRSEWIWACSFHFTWDHICDHQSKYEKNAVEGIEMSLCEFLRLDDFNAYFAHLVSGIGRRTEAQLDPDKPGFGWQQHWCYRGSGLVFGEDAEESVRRGGGKAIWIQTEPIEGEIDEICERKATLKIGAEMCQVHHADLSEFELVLFISLETGWYVSIRGSMRRMR